MTTRMRRAVGRILFLIGIGLTTLLAFGQGGKNPPSRSTDALLVVLIALAQGGAAWSFGKVGKADPAHAQQSAARLWMLAQRAEAAEKTTQGAFESNKSAKDLHTDLGIASANFSWIVDLAMSSIEDWRAFYPEAISELGKDAKE